MSVCFSVSLPEDIHSALMEAIKTTQKKRNEYVREAVTRCLKQDGYLDKHIKGYEEIKEVV